MELKLSDWGSGTQNRVHILLSILQASRLKSSQNAENTTTPVVIIEEPESFLHPTAQAEFGRVLQLLAEDEAIQIICTTHSPYMLNQVHPEANILLDRKVSYGKPRETIRVDTTGDNWMKPFADQLGVIPPEFEVLRKIITSKGRRVILVEGVIDQEYFEYFRERHPDIFQLPEDVEINEYGGKDTLKNTPLLKFALDRFERFAITFDLDAINVVERSLISLGYEKEKNYFPIGVNKSRAQCIEGLLPVSIKQSVYAANTELVDAAQGGDTAERKSAKNKLKRKMLEELKSSNVEGSELGNFKKMFGQIAKAF